MSAPERAERLREVVARAADEHEYGPMGKGEGPSQRFRDLAPVVIRAICEELGLDGECVCFGPRDMDAKRNPMVTPDYETHVARAILTLLEAGGTDET